MSWRAHRVQVMAYVHQALFGHEMSQHMQDFVRQLSFSFVGYVGANSLLFVAVVLAGRLLGPLQFGQYALVMAVSQVLIIPMVLGIDSAVMREVALKPKNLEEIISSGFIMQALFSLITVIVLLTIDDLISNRLDIPVDIIRVAVIVALAVGLRAFFDGVVRGQRYFKLQSAVRMIDASVVLFVLIGGYYLAGWDDFRLLSMGITLGALAATCFFGWWGGGWLLALSKSSLAMARRLWLYGSPGVLGAVAGILLVSADKIILRNTVGTSALGVYQAHYFASVQLSGQLAYIFLNVFFPTVVRERDLSHVLRKLDRLLAISLLPAGLVIGAFIWLTLQLFSFPYSREASLIPLMSVYAVLWFVFMTYWTLVASTGPKGIWYASTHALIAGILYVVMVNQLVRPLGLHAPGAAFILAFVYMAGAIWLWRTKLRHTMR